jgi:lipopolysaccharide O-acetyltransferase
LKLARLLKAWSAFGSVRNRLLNSLAGGLSGAPVAIDWRNVKIAHPDRISIGRNFSAGHSLWLESVQGQGQLTIGDDVNFSDSVHIGCARSVTIGDGVLLGSKVLITDHSHGGVGSGGASTTAALVPPNRRPIVSKGPVSIGRSVWLGDGVCVLAGVTIGDGAIVGANSVVVRDVPAATVWAGVPARQVWPQTAPAAV